ncbi:MAG: sulfatase [Planctomycetes bacterium]|nr:sulfatase [Planctomycetota bacterium]
MRTRERSERWTRASRARGSGLDARLFAGAGLLAVLVSIACSREDADRPQSAKERPLNVLLVVLDTLRADRLGAYGNARPTSPGLDALAREACVFENAQTAAPLTVASLLSLMTSLYPEVHGVQGSFNPGKMSAKVTTLAEVLSARGYSTAAFTEGGYARPDFGLGQGFQTYPRPPSDDDPNVTNLLRDSRLAANLARTTEWLRANHERPFFLFFHTYEIHAPYWTREENVRRMRPSFDEAADHARAAAAIERWNREHATTRADCLTLLQHLYQCPLTGLPALADPDGFERAARGFELAPDDAVRRDEVLELVRDLYDASIRTTDDALEQLWSVLRELRLDENTIVVVTSDHGEGLGQHGEMEHSNVLHEEALRVPLWIRVPRPGYAARRVRELARTVDVVPTLLDVLDVDARKLPLQGRSLGPLLRGESTADAPRMAFSHARRVVPGQPAQFTLRDDHWRLIDEPDTPRRWLYDRAADPEERLDVAAAHPEVVARLAALLDRQRAADRWLQRALAAAPEALELDEAARKELRGLGYVEGEDGEAVRAPR